MTQPSSPLFRDLTREESLALLERNHVGRLAYARGNNVDLEPVSYVYADGWIYGRTSEGRKTEMTGQTWWPVVFEVDEVTNQFHWNSVVVHGGFYTLPEGGPAWQREERDRAIEHLRKLVPNAFMDGDPVAFRDIVFRIAVQEIRGRSAMPEVVGE